MAVSPRSTVSHLVCWEGTPNLEICVKFESQHVGGNGTMGHIRETGRNPQSKANPPICPMHLRKVMKHSINNGFLSLVVQHHICKNAKRVSKIWRNCIFVWNLRLNLGLKWLTVQPIKVGCEMLPIGPPISPYASNEGYEMHSSHSQWMALIAVHHDICRAKRVSQIWQFMWTIW